jgi:mRNA interferase RelE/StbE
MNSGRAMTYKLNLSKRATKYLSRLPRKTATRILDKLELLKSDPYHAPDTKSLEGRLGGLWRMEVGPYRATYKIEEDGHIVVVLIIGPRGDVYKHL